MSKKINPASIGLFIVTGVALGVTGLLVFSSGRFFTQTREVIVYFNDALNGLNEGAPVKYRGVTIGTVKRVMIRFNQSPEDYSMPVLLEIQSDLVNKRLGDAAAEAFTEDVIQDYEKLWLRASLQTESLVTGVLYVEIRPNPKAPPPVYHQVQKIYREMPSEPTQIQELFNNLATLDLKSIEQNLNGLLVKLDRTVDSLGVAQINQGLTNVLASLDRLVTSPDITNALASLGPTLENYRTLGEKLNQRVDPLADGVTNSLAEANRTLAEFRGAAENLRSMLSTTSPMRNDLDQALEQVGAAAQSISALVDFLNQHPNAIITGRQFPQRRP